MSSAALWCLGQVMSSPVVIEAIILATMTGIAFVHGSQSKTIDEPSLHAEIPFTFDTKMVELQTQFWNMWTTWSRIDEQITFPTSTFPTTVMVTWGFRGEQNGPGSLPCIFQCHRPGLLLWLCWLLLSSSAPCLHPTPYRNSICRRTSEARPCNYGKQLC